MLKVMNEGKYSDAEKKKIYAQWKEYCKKNYKKFIPEYGPDGYTDAMYDQWVKVLKKESGDSNAKTESLDDDDFERYTYMASKDVNDADGYLTEYTMYFDEVEGRYVFVFGDSDYYNPNDGYEEFDWETESRDEAEDWFRDYDGFSDELESKKITESEAKKILVVADGRAREVSPDRFNKYAKMFGYGSCNLSFKYIGSKHGNVDDHTCYEVDISGCSSYKDAIKAVRTICDYVFGTGNYDLRTYDEDTVSEFTESKEELEMIKIIDEASYGQRRSLQNKIIAAAKKALKASDGKYTETDLITIPEEFDTDKFWTELKQTMKNQGITMTQYLQDDNEDGLEYKFGVELYGDNQKWWKNR